MISKTTNERDVILADPIICAVLKSEAEYVGVSLEEYVDRFLEAFYSKPEKFYSLLTKQI